MPAFGAGAGWSGCFAGLHAGYGWLEAKATDLPFDSGPLAGQGIAWNTIEDPRDVLRFTSNGLLLGGQAGCDLELGGSSHPIVAGFVADILHAGMQDRATSRLQEDTSGEIGPAWMGTLRARLGVDLGGVLAYATGGLAWASIDAGVSDDAVAPGPGLMEISGHELRAGWTVGAGLEWRVARSLGLSLEYLHVELDGLEVEGQATLPIEAYPRFKFDDIEADLVRIGINWRM